MSFDAAADRQWRATLAGASSLIQRGDCYGLERESLRVLLSSGELAQTPHPAALGSSLTNRFITTDFSESQLEFTTSPYRNFAGLLRELRYLQIFAREALSPAGPGDHPPEGLWPLSMPALLPDEDQIPIAWYGNSDTGQKKYIYRQGLSRRYGRRMQTVSGVHFNFSFSRRFFRALAQAIPRNDLDPATHELNLQNQIYFSIIRNFQRESVYLMYLFGASPAVHRSFMYRDDHRLQSFDFEPETLYAPNATSLRLSDIGYTNSNQCELAISYDGLPDYISTMCRAVGLTNPAYSQWSFARGEQLNDHYLQIENEHYGVIRPKQTPQPDERPLTALERRGVRYLEVRCLDIDPYTPGGVSEERMAFVHLVLINNLLNESPPLSRADCKLQRDNQVLVAWHGRDPDLKIKAGADLEPRNFREAGLDWVAGMADLARRLDREIGCERYERSLEAQLAKFRDPELTPSAQMLREMRTQRLGHIDFGLQLLQRHRESLREQELPPAVRRKFEHAVQESIRKYDAIESAVKSHLTVAMPEVCSG